MDTTGELKSLVFSHNTEKNSGLELRMAITIKSLYALLLLHWKV